MTDTPTWNQMPRLTGNIKWLYERFLPSPRIESLKKTQKNHVFIASDALPLFDQESGGLRLKTIIDVLCKENFQVIFASLKTRNQTLGMVQTEKKLKWYEQRLRSSGVREIIYGIPAIDTYLQNHGAAIKYAMVAFPLPGTCLIPLLRLNSPDCVVIYDMVDFHALRIRREAFLSGSQSKIREADLMEQTELALFRAADIVLAVSDEECELVRKEVTDAKVFTVPNAFEVPALSRHGFASRKNILFLGGFWHTPNEDAVKWFVNDVWPIVHRENPGFEFHIAGSNMNSRIHQLANHNGVKIIGYVSDLSSFFNSGRVFVAPLRFGAGMKGKVGQSMAFGVPVVSTQIGAEGMHITHGEEMMIADSPIEFAKHISKLLNSERDWLHIQARAQHFVQNNLSVDALRSRIREVFQ